MGQKNQMPGILLGKKVKKLIKVSKYRTLLNFALEFGLSERGFRKKLNEGHGLTDFEDIIRICELLGIAVSTLLSGF